MGVKWNAFKDFTKQSKAASTSLGVAFNSPDLVKDAMWGSVGGAITSGLQSHFTDGDTTGGAMKGAAVGAFGGVVAGKFVQHQAGSMPKVSSMVSPHN